MKSFMGKSLLAAALLTAGSLKAVVGTNWTTAGGVVATPVLQYGLNQQDSTTQAWVNAALLGSAVAAAAVATEHAIAGHWGCAQVLALGAATGLVTKYLLGNKEMQHDASEVWSSLTEEQRTKALVTAKNTK